MATKFEGLNNNPIVDDINDVKTDTSLNVEDVTEQISDVPRTPTDPNKIHVNVNDRRAPIVLLFGAPSSGKTMTLVRLAKYLKGKGYMLKIDENFVTTRDVWEYEENSKGFNKMLGTTTALGGTNRNDFLFVKVVDSHGKIICQILEGAGEDYFPMNGENRVEASFPSYMDGVFGTTNKKVWIFITEPNWKVNKSDKIDYVNRIAWCKNQYFNRNDKAIILYNKIDRVPELLYGQGQVHVKSAMEYCNNEYSDSTERGTDGITIFNIFKNPSPLAGLLFPKYLCKFVPFCTGKYSEALKREEQHYTLSHPSYPAALWETIMDCIKS
ncbi:MAG: hypothetical protein IJ718_03305 [Paludibacteraceae bacterium]|nr:hypothetical protein [Paludibacteraceae bacterium]